MTTPRNILSLAELAYLDSASFVLRKLARASGADWAEIVVAGDGRVTIAAVHDGERVWVADASVAADAVDPRPSTAVAVVELNPR
jgi:hypothetical protein